MNVDVAVLEAREKKARERKPVEVFVCRLSFVVVVLTQ
jgi:hypothetical protein